MKIFHDKRLLTHGVEEESSRDGAEVLLEKRSSRLVPHLHHHHGLVLPLLLWNDLEGLTGERGDGQGLLVGGEVALAGAGDEGAPTHPLAHGQIYVTKNMFQTMIS